MTIQLITSALGSNRTVTSYVNGVDADGELIAYGGIYLPFRANAVIAKGALLAFVVPTATVPLSVKERVTGDLTVLTAGVAMKAATVAGQIIDVCVFGACQINVAGGTAAAGSYGIHSATTGIVDVAATALDATSINGNVLGFFQGAKDANNRAGFFYNRM